jgi:hypothetical protein
MASEVLRWTETFAAITAAADAIRHDPASPLEALGSAQKLEEELQVAWDAQTARLATGERSAVDMASYLKLTDAQVAEMDLVEQAYVRIYQAFDRTSVVLRRLQGMMLQNARKDAPHVFVMSSSDEFDESQW